MNGSRSVPDGGRYDFEDGGTYCGGWEDGKAHGHGVCTGPKGQGEYCGQWAYGFEACGVYTWPSGNNYQGQWMQGKRHGLGIERKDKWVYKGEWTQGFKGRYGIRLSVTSGAKYEGTWTTGLQDGYGCETYADGGTYQGQWLRGCRHGYGVRQSVPYGLAAHYRAQTLRSSLTSLRSEDEDDRIVKSRDKRIDETRGGFVLSGKADSHHETSSFTGILEKPRSLKRSIVNTLKLKKQRSTGDLSDSAAVRHHKFSSSMRSTRSFASQNSTLSVESGVSTTSKHTADYSDDQSFYSQDDITDVNVTEAYMGEWKGDKRSGFGVSERSDGLRYEGEWYNNKKYGYGVTTFKDGSREEGKYKNNILVSSGTKNRLMVLQKSKMKERILTAVNAAQRAAQLAMQKGDIAVSRMANARAKADQALHAAETAKQDSDIARLKAKEIDPSFHQPGTHILKKQQEESLREAELALARKPYNPQLRSHSLVERSSRGGSPIGRGAGASDSTNATIYHAVERAIPQVEKVTATITQRPERSTDLSKTDHHKNNGHIIPQAISHLEAAPSSGRGHSSPGPRLSYADRGNPSVPPKPRRLETRTSLGQLLNSNVLSDHFDHYGAPSLAKDAPDSNHNYSNYRSRLPCEGTINEEPIAPTSTNYTHEVPEAARRPSTSFGRASTTRAPARTLTTLSKDDSDLHRLENDVRKRLKSTSAPRRTRDDIAIPSAARLAYKQRESNFAALSRQGVGSLPDITTLNDLVSMPKEELMKLSASRREEIRRLLEEQERRNAGDISVLANDFKKWISQRQLMMFVVGVNAALASVVFNMMGG